MSRKTNPLNVMVSAVTPLGPTVVSRGPSLTDSCRRDALAGTTATRLTSFLTMFPDRDVWTTSCDTDWTDSMVMIAELLRTVIGYPCIDGVPVDLDPARPDLQPDIAAWIDDIYAHSSFVVPACGTHGAERCYRLTEDNLNCTSTPTHLALTVEPPLFSYPAYLNADIAVE